MKENHTPTAVEAQPADHPENSKPGKSSRGLSIREKNRQAKRAKNKAEGKNPDTVKAYSVDSVRRNRPRTAGRPLTYQPEQLGDKFDEYAEWAKSNPLQGVQVLKDGEIVNYPIRRPLTLEGFARFAGIRSITFRTYEDSEPFHDVCQSIRDAIRADQLEAALANQCNPMIAARILKLRDGADITTGGQPMQAAPQAINLTYNGQTTTITADDIG